MRHMEVPRPKVVKLELEVPAFATATAAGVGIVAVAYVPVSFVSAEDKLKRPVFSLERQTG